MKIIALLALLSPAPLGWHLTQGTAPVPAAEPAAAPSEDFTPASLVACQTVTGGDAVEQLGVYADTLAGL